MKNIQLFEIFGKCFLEKKCILPKWTQAEIGNLNRPTTIKEIPCFKNTLVFCVVIKGQYKRSL